MRRFTTAVIALSFLTGVVGMAQAQTPAPAPADKPADKVEKLEKPGDKKAGDKKAGDKKPAEKTAKADKSHKGHTDAAKPAMKPAEKSMDKPAEKAPAAPAPTTTEKK